MPKFKCAFVFLLFIGLFAAYAPLARADQPAETPASGMDWLGRPTEALAPQHDESGYGSKVGGKLLNAFANLTTSILEIPKAIINTTNKSNVFYGVGGGVIKGLVNTVGRMGVGVVDLVTFPLPTRPIVQPAYIWDNFDVDTTYGPIFRLDEAKEK